MLRGGDTGQSDPATAGSVSTAASAAWNTGSVRLGGATRDSTLLGPERTTESRQCAVRLFFSARHDLVTYTVRGFGVWWVTDRVVGWSLVENCTVDASILFSVVKLSRANGGCLGTRSR